MATELRLNFYLDGRVFSVVSSLTESGGWKTTTKGGEGDDFLAFRPFTSEMAPQW